MMDAINVNTAVQYQKNSQVNLTPVQTPTAPPLKPASYWRNEMAPKPIYIDIFEISRKLLRADMFDTLVEALVEALGDCLQDADIGITCIGGSISCESWRERKSLYERVIKKAQKLLEKP